MTDYEALEIGITFIDEELEQIEKDGEEKDQAAWVTHLREAMVTLRKIQKEKK